ncbi:tRNA glutamyl-Q(34) synthetase GluQRS [Tepidicaulis sp. LMO-SS28]|uniref:tRNA glutamyl-Q(34) synthetase GluQRS n=1 Tax=Tepidicaulis sp. LMO-SS28 TaxID=3447455 RepID=UPI003EE14821
MPPTTPFPVFRFAPSPNGYLHLGHAYSAYQGAEAAAREGGRFLLRIEDIDIGRCREEYVDAIYEDLAWLGLSWERPVLRQSARFALYEDALKTLRGLGVVYPCFATRKEIIAAIEDSGVALERWPRDPDGALIYPGLYKDLPPRELSRLMWEGISYAWRLDMEKAKALAEEMAGGPLTFLEEGTGPKGETGRLPIEPELYGDVVVARKDVPTSYHIAVTIDDAAQGITHITRGQDLFYMTHVHRVLQVLLGLPEPIYRHHALIRDETGRRLSKTAADRGIRELREAGKSPEDVRRLIGLEAAL